jgi:hypothetical protein
MMRHEGLAKRRAKNGVYWSAPWGRTADRALKGEGKCGNAQPEK